MKLIGKGAFTKAYLLDNDKVLLDSSCPIKEVMALGWFPDDSLFPTLERTDSGYLMEYYPKVRSLKNSLDADQYEIYKSLRKVYNDIRAARNIHDAYMECTAAFERAMYNNVISEELYELMQEAIDACCNAGSDISFEISPRNVAVKDGKLILLDCFYSLGALQKVRNK